MAISYLFVFIFGLIVGSFLNCVIYRLEVGKSFLKGRSFCPDCKHDLSWLDLIPVFSYIFLSGKCRYCDKKISIQYPLVEISTGLVFLLIFQSLLSTASSYFLFSVLYFLTAASLLIIIFVFDLKHFIIPDRVLFPLTGIALIYSLISNLQSLNGLINIFVSAFSAGAFFLAIYLVSRGKWLGFGDVKLAFFMGLLLGFPDIIVALYSAFTIGAIIGVGLILAKRKNMKSEIPFGPFLIIGTMIAFFWGNQIINWYFNLFS
ncbi:MAG: prepilin peptidase [Candidatus Nealsonbacteria bacterium]|nr:prepilin peptidase [Candidatus Nealsonbacteria bacterium]